MSNFNYVKYCRFLSYLLRHNPDTLKITDDGFVCVEELIDYSNCKGKFITKDLLHGVVKFDDKQRFSFNEDFSMIRANQGHSINVDLRLTKAVPNVYLFHGTSPSNKDSILKNGINKMKRNHVHLSKDLSIAFEVGHRHCRSDETPCVFLINVFEMVEDGYDFYLSDNGVWLTDYIPSKYLIVVNKFMIRRRLKIANISEEDKCNFLKELFELYKKYGVSIGHEDCQGSFILNNYSENDIKWISEIETFNNDVDFVRRYF